MFKARSLGHDVSHGIKKFELAEQKMAKPAQLVGISVSSLGGI